MKVNVDLKSLVLNEELITGSLFLSSSEKLPKDSYIKFFYHLSNTQVEETLIINLSSYSTIQTHVVNIPIVNIGLELLTVEAHFEVHYGSELIKIEKTKYEVHKIENVVVETSNIPKFKGDKPEKIQRQYLEKIVFVINSAEMLNHYRSTLESLPNDKVALLIKDDGQEVVDSAKEFDVDIYSLKEIKKRNLYFSVVVSNHYLAANPYPMKNIGKQHVRFCYSLGYKAWDTSDWNKSYDSIICWGPYHKKILSSYTQAKFVEVGYPRLDNISKVNIVASDAEKNKKVLLWLPTCGELCSIDRYIKEISDLKKQYHILIKPHPICYESNKPEIELIRQYGLVLLSKFVNNADYINTADLILADYGGSAFAAIHENKKVILLNLIHAADNKLIGEGSLDIELRKYIPNIDSPEQLEDMICNEDIWTGYETTLSNLQKQYFFKRDGKAGKRAASHLLDELSDGSKG